MALDGCGQLCKYVLILCNIVFALVGFAMLGLGLWLRFSESTRGLFEIELLSSSAFVIGVTVLIVLGSVMVIVVAFGDYGVCNGSICALQVFSVLLFLLAITVGGAGVIAYTKSEEVGAQLAEFYASLYAKQALDPDPVVAATLMFLQKLFHCCGITGFHIVESDTSLCPKPSGFLETFVKMPACPSVIASSLVSQAPAVLAVFLVTGALLLLALVCSQTLTCKLRLSRMTPDYIILSSSVSTVSTTQPYPQHSLVATFDQDPVVFTPLTTANIPPARA